MVGICGERAYGCRPLKGLDRKATACQTPIGCGAYARYKPKTPARSALIIDVPLPKESNGRFHFLTAALSIYDKCQKKRE